MISSSCAPPPLSSPIPLKSSRGFLAIYKRGRWLHSPCLSLGWLHNDQAITRVGIRTRRGTKGSVVRNRLKRQLKAVLQSPQHQVQQAVDMIFVLHPPGGTVTSSQLKVELLHLCHRAKLL